MWLHVGVGKALRQKSFHITKVIGMECTVSWTGGAGTRSGMGFVAETGSGHVLTMDGAPDAANPANMHFTVSGKGLAAPVVERAIAMSHEKYCSASIMLGKTAAITTSFEVLEA